MDPTIVETVDRGPRAVARSARVRADAHDLFATLANPHRHHEVDGSGTVRPEVVGPRELRLGDRFRVSMKMLGVPYAITSTVTALEPDRLVEWAHPGGHRWRWEFEPAGDGTTLVTEVFDYSGTRLPALIEAIKAPRRNAEAITQSLHRLQATHAG